MGNFWSCLSDKSNQAIASAAEAPVLEPIPETAPSTINDLLDGKSNQAIASEAEDPVLKLIPDPDPAPSSINDLIDGGISFLGGTGDISPSTRLWFLIRSSFISEGREDSKRLIPWEKRVKIATEMAHGLNYLHTLEKPIIFRDFKSSNVLLDESYTPKISDFGLAKWAPATGDTYITGQVVGTKGYAAPEYVRDGKLYIKSDVYSFGVVLVEMLTGLRVIDPSRPPQQQNLLNWIKPKLSERRQLKHIMDPRLEGKYPPRLASRMALVSALCLGDDPQFRPSMKEVSDKLERIAKSQETKKM